MDYGAIEHLFPRGVCGVGNIAVPIRPGYRFCLAYVRVHFRRLSGSGTEVADFTIDLDSQLGDDFDVRLATLPKVGVSYDVNVGVSPDDYHRWILDSADGLTFNWTNPETGGEISWGLTAGIRRVT